MTKKHYEAIAAVIKSNYNNAALFAGQKAEDKQETLVVVACQFADVFAADNKNFNRNMFLAACGIEQS